MIYQTWRAVRRMSNQNGQDMVEYALITGLVSIIAIAALLATGETIRSYWETLSTSIPVL